MNVFVRLGSCMGLDITVRLDKYVYYILLYV